MNETMSEIKASCHGTDRDLFKELNFFVRKIRKAASDLEKSIILLDEETDTVNRCVDTLVKL